MRGLILCTILLAGCIIQPGPPAPYPPGPNPAPAPDDTRVHVDPAHVQAAKTAAGGDRETLAVYRELYSLSKAQVLKGSYPTVKDSVETANKAIVILELPTFYKVVEQVRASGNYQFTDRDALTQDSPARREYLRLLTYMVAVCDQAR